MFHTVPTVFRPEPDDDITLNKMPSSACAAATLSGYTHETNYISSLCSDSVMFLNWLFVEGAVESLK